MENLGVTHDPNPHKKSNTQEPTREMLFLAEQSAEGKLKILPSKEWSLHYPVDKATREEKLRGLLDGKYSATEVAHDITPDALFYDAQDIQTQGLGKVSGRIRDLSAFIAHYDFPRYAQFVENMRDRKIPLEDLDDTYSDITRARVQKKLMDSYGYTGRKQIEDVLRTEADDVIKNINDFSQSQKVLKALKVNWLNENLGLASMDERDRVISQLSGSERELFQKLEVAYRDYIQNGDEEGYRKITQTVQEGLPKIQRETISEKSSESMQKLEKELEVYKDQVVPPGSPEDPAIAPDDNDEYHTPSPQTGESKEKTRERPIFEISPALGGYYISGRKSYYNIETKTWSKKKKLAPYDTSFESKEAFNISGFFNEGLKSLPLPNGYALDASSLKVKGNKPNIFRDQSGCFYLETKGEGSFSVDFKKEKTPLVSSPIAEDLEQLYKGSLSQKTETVINRLIGTPIQKAEQVRQYILANHFYPGGGDLDAAQALQYKLRSESSGENYLQNIDVSEYLECYSANTKFVAMMRKTGVPTRLVNGHRVEGAKKGKSAITQGTGHAWSEIWDGNMWRRFDATPNTKPEDEKKSDNEKDESKNETAEEAQDGGVDSPQEKQNQEKEKEGSQGEKAGDQKSEKSSESGNPLEQVSEASDSEMQQGKEQLQQAKEKVEKMTEEKKQFDEKVQKAEKFKEISDLQKEIEKSELFEDMKKELEKKLEVKEDQMKDQIKDELDKMVEDGFMDEEKREEILKKLEEKKLAELDLVQKEVEKENKLYSAYEDIREEVMPTVDRWFRYFAERLPRKEEVGFDEDSLTRQGAFNRHAVMRPRNLLFGTVKNPREIRPSIEPRFMSSILIDVSGSMSGDKLLSARKLLVFYSELFSRISETFGYIRFSIDIFSDSVTEIKGFEQDYDSPKRYDFEDGTRSTVKVRLMQKLATRGGTNMLDGIKKAAHELNKQVEEYPDYASAFYFVGDGGDTCGNAENIKKFLQINDSERGFGEHMYSAILLGDEKQRAEIANIFGDDHTNVVPDFDELIEKSMDKFDEDLSEYLRDKIR